MPDTKEADNPTTTKTDTAHSESIFDGEISDDWGEAFEADDFTLSAEDDVSDEFAFEEDSEEQEADKAAAAQKKESKLKTETTGTAQPSLVQSLLAQLKSILQRYTERFLLLPILYRVPIIVGFCLVIFSPYFFSKTAPLIPPSPIQSKLVEPLATEDIAPPPEIDTTQSAAPTAETPPKAEIRKKWHFPSFLISTSDKMKGDNIFFVEVDITFILLLSEGETIPTEKAVFLRDIIYQFFNNRPLYELRRYSLARGEMSRKLRSWVEKQWPEGNIASIVFNRYQVL